MDKINFKNYPNTETPISADNLNLLQTNVENYVDDVKNYVDGMATYSDEETFIGYFKTNGELVPLYRKVITYTTALPSGNINIAHGITNLGMITNFRANYYTASGNVRSDQYGSSNYHIFVNGINDTNIIITVSSGYSNSFTKTIIVLEYTKVQEEDE